MSGKRVSTPQRQPASAPEAAGAAPSGESLRISEAAARWGVSPRTLRYYEELGLLRPSSYTSGGERRYAGADLERMGRILELRDVLGMNLDEIREFLDAEHRLDDLRSEYRARKELRTTAARAQQREILNEILTLNDGLATQIDAKLERMKEFRDRLRGKAKRCRELLQELG